jgi:hypothetical protein
LPTDDFIEPNAREFYLMGRMEGKPRDTGTAPAASNTAGGVESDFGHDIE